MTLRIPGRTRLSTQTYTPNVVQTGATITSPSAVFQRLDHLLIINGIFTVTVGATNTITISMPSGYTGALALGVGSIGSVAANTSTPLYVNSPGSGNLAGSSFTTTVNNYMFFAVVITQQ